ncbi:MAG: hypothetical protein QW597_01355 [Thermoplasmataceae archaeon]
MSVKQKLEEEILNFKEQSQKLKAEISDLEDNVERKRQRFMEAEADMEKSDTAWESLAKSLRGKGIEPPERD